MGTITNTLVTIVTIIAFCGLGALTGYAQASYENSTAKGSAILYEDDFVQERKHMTITYGIAGAGLGIVLASVGSLQRQIRGRESVVFSDTTSKLPAD